MSRPSDNDKIPQRKRPVKTFTDPITKTRKFETTNAATKDAGVTSGGFIISKSRRDPNIKKYWLEKGTMFESLIKKLNSINVDNFNYWNDVSCFLNETERSQLNRIENYFNNPANIDNINEALDQKHEELLGLSAARKRKEIEYIASIANQILGMVIHHTGNNNKLSLLVGAVNTMKIEESGAVANYLINGLREITEATISKITTIEKATELLAGELNRLVTNRRSTPKTSLLQDCATGYLTVLSRISLNIDGTKSSDLFDFIANGEKETQMNESGNNIPTPFRSLLLKPVKGLYESIIIRLFLEDNPTDIKLGNIIITDQGGHWQIDNIDFGNAFMKSNKLDAKLINPDFLIDSIDEIGNLRMNRDQSRHQHYHSLLKNVSDEQEIIDTIGKISQLKDEDLLRITENLKEMITIKEQEGKKQLVELIPQNYRKKYFEHLKTRRDQMKVLYESIIARPQIVENNPSTQENAENASHEQSASETDQEMATNIPFSQKDSDLTENIRPQSDNVRPNASESLETNTKKRNREDVMR